MTNLDPSERIKVRLNHGSVTTVSVDRYLFALFTTLYPDDTRRHINEIASNCSNSRDFQRALIYEIADADLVSKCSNFDLFH